MCPLFPPIGITLLQCMKNVKITLCQALSVPPPEVGFSDKVFGDELMITEHTSSGCVPEGSHLRTYFQHRKDWKRASKEKGDFVIPVPRESALYLMKRRTT